MSAAQSGFEIIGQGAVSVAVVLPRIAAAFLVLPLLTAETMPPLVRNSFFVSLGIIVLPLAGGLNAGAVMSGAQWMPLLMKEVLIGIAIGIAFGGVFWAINAAGEVMDAKIGTNMASVVDPIQGHQTSLTGTFLSQFAAWLFMASGAFMVFLDLLLSSYSIWPVGQMLPDFGEAGMFFFLGEFRYLMTATLLLAAPALVLMTVFDISFGLINRYAPQLNLFMLTMPIKSLIATFTLILLLGVFAEVVLRHVFEQQGLLNALIRVFR